MNTEVHAPFSDNCSVSVFFLHTCNHQYVVKAVTGRHQTLVTSSHDTATLIPECTIQLHILSLCLSLSHVSCRPSRPSTTYIHRYIYTDIHNYLGTYIRSRLSSPLADQQVTSFLSLSVTSIRAYTHTYVVTCITLCPKLIETLVAGKLHPPAGPTSLHAQLAREQG